MITKTLYLSWNFTFISWSLKIGSKGQEDVVEVANTSISKDLISSEVPLFQFQSIVAATNNFDEANKLGEGGFGPVYKVVFPPHCFYIIMLNVCHRKIEVCQYYCVKPKLIIYQIAGEITRPRYCCEKAVWKLESRFDWIEKWSGAHCETPTQKSCEAPGLVHSRRRKNAHLWISSQQKPGSIFIWWVLFSL